MMLPDRHDLFQKTGMRSGRHAPNLVNPPNRPDLHWRLATASAFFEEMKERLKYTTRDGDLLPTPTGPLTDLVRNPETDWAAALMKSWSVVGDILCFYQERLINEGYIGTAIRPDSITFLSATLGGDFGPAGWHHMSGYFRFPGTAGSAQVIMIVREGEGFPNRQTLRRNNVLRRVTPGGGGPLEFAVTADTLIDSRWNRLSPKRPENQTKLPVKPVITRAGEVFEGSQLKLKAGDLLLAAQQVGTESLYNLCHITSVRVQQPFRETTVTFRADGNSQNDRAIETNTSPIYRQTRSYAAFGAEAPRLVSQSLAMRMQHIASGGVEIWSPKINGTSPNKAQKTDNNGLPAHPVTDFLVTRDGTFYLATTNGVLYREPSSVLWKEANLGLVKRKIQTLCEDKNGLIYAGTVSGGAYRSLGHGSAWSSLPAGYIIKSGPLGKKTSLKTSLPATTVNKLALGENAWPLAEGDDLPASLTGLVVAATDNGLFGNDQKGTGWLSIPMASTGSETSGPSGSQPQSATPLLDAVIICQDSKSFIITASEKTLTIVPYAKQNQISNNGKTAEDPKSSDHGAAKIPNILVVAFDALAKIGEIAARPVTASSKKILSVLKKVPASVQKTVEWIADVDPLHWASGNLPYPGSTIELTGKFISLQVFRETGKICIAVSTTSGLYRFDPESGQMQSMQEGLPTSLSPAPKLSPVKEPALFGGALLVILYQNRIYGYFDTGQWQPLMTLPASQGEPALKPSYPEQVLCDHEGRLCTIRPLFFQTEWPDFHFGNKAGSLHQIDVAGLKENILPGTVGALVNKDESKRFFFTINVVKSLVRQDFGLKSPVKRLEISAITPSFIPGDFDRRTAKVILPGKQLISAFPVSAETKIIAGARLDITGAIPDLTGRTIAIRGPAARALPVPLGGILNGSVTDDGFKPDDPAALPLRDIRSLTLLPDNQILAVAPDGVWQGAIGHSWTQVQDGISDDNAVFLKAYMRKEGGHFLLSKTNLYTRGSSSAPWTCCNTPQTGSSFTSFLDISNDPASAKAGAKLLGTKGDGLFFRKPNETNWTPVTWTPIARDATILSMEETGDGSVFIGTDSQGLFHVTPDLSNWVRIDLPAPLKTIPILQHQGMDLLIGTHEGALYRLHREAGKYRLTSLYALPEKTAILDIATTENQIVAGLQGGGLLSSRDNGKNWSSCTTGLCGSVHALLRLAENWLIAMSPELPDPASQNTALIKPQRLFEIAADPYIAELDQRLFSQSLETDLVQAKAKLPKNPAVHILCESMSWLLLPANTDKPEEKHEAMLLLLNEGNRIIVSRLEGTFPILAKKTASSGGLDVFDLSLSSGRTLRVNSYPNQIVLRPALAKDPSGTELLTVSQCLEQPDIDATTLATTHSLQTIFEAGRTEINGNIVSLSQGQIVKDDVIGDGNAAASFQSFTLKAGQLVFIEPTPNDVQPALSVTVDGLPFRQIADLSAAGPKDRVFILSLNDKGIATLTFGDGITGTRLPTGTGNVKASYRANMTPFDAEDDKARFILTDPPYGLSTSARPALQPPQDHPRN